MSDPSFRELADVASSLQQFTGLLFVLGSHHNDGAGAAHAGLGIDASLPQNLNSVFQVHDFNAGDGRGAGLSGGSLNFFSCSGSGSSGSLTLSQDLGQTCLLSSSVLSLGNLEDLTLDQLCSELQSVGDQGSAGSTGDDQDQILVALANAGEIGRASCRERV